MAGVLERGQAVIEASRDRRLYREAGHATFEDYCQKRWGFERAHAYRLMEAASVSAALSPIGDTPPPANEAQARELAPLMRQDPDRAAEVWRDLRETKGDAVTAGDVREAVRTLRLGLRAPSRPTPAALPPGAGEDDPLAAKTPKDIAATIDRLLTMGSTFILARDGRTVWHEPAPDVMESLLTAPTHPTRRRVETSLLWSALGEVPKPLLYRCITRAIERSRALGVTVDELLREGPQEAPGSPQTHDAAADAQENATEAVGGALDGGG